jgi:hypothetical protein
MAFLAFVPWPLVVFVPCLLRGAPSRDSWSYTFALRLVFLEGGDLPRLLARAGSEMPGLLGDPRLRTTALLPSRSTNPPNHANGGCEGLVMSNHTNRTLSANLLGLNLGTQSLGQSAGVVNVAKTTLRIRHSHPDMGIDLMRSGAISGPGYLHECGEPGTPSLSPSSWLFTPSMPAWRLVERPRAEVVAKSATSKRKRVSVVRNPRTVDVAGPRAATARAAFPPTTRSVVGG